MAAAADLTIGFGTGGNSAGFIGGGWARAEPTFTWAIGPESQLVLPANAGGDDCILTLDVVPFVQPPDLPAQRLAIAINDTVIGSSVVTRPTLLGCVIPAALLRRQDRLLVTLRHPDAARPADLGDSADPRTLAFAVVEAKLYRMPDPAGQDGLPSGVMLDGGYDRPFGARSPVEPIEWATRRTGLTLPQLALQFESLGENCEFGLVQRRCEAEPLGLLRFSSTFLRNLIRGLDSGFEGLGDPADVDPRLEGDGRREFMIHERRYGLIYHTFVYEGQRSPALMRDQEAARLKFLRRKFLEELDVAEKIFVYKRNGVVSEDEILPLYLALNRYGRQTLLWVVPADGTRAAGTVEVVLPGLLKGYIDRFAPETNAHAFSFEGWIKVCAGAYLLSRQWIGSSS